MATVDLFCEIKMQKTNWTLQCLGVKWPKRHIAALWFK